MAASPIAAVKTVFPRLTAFVRLCIGVPVLRDGLAEPLAPWKAARR